MILVCVDGFYENRYNKGNNSKRGFLPLTVLANAAPFGVALVFL